MNRVLISPPKQKPRFAVGVVGTDLCSESSTGVCSMQIYVEDLIEMAPSDKQFEDLKKRVKDLEKPTESVPLNASWVQRHQVLVWLISLLSIWVALYAGI